MTVDPALLPIFQQLNPHKIHFGHRILNVTEIDDKVIIHLSNNNTFYGDIVVGADGAYSVVHHRMYETLKPKGDLSKGDHEELPFKRTYLVGQTNLLYAMPSKSSSDVLKAFEEYHKERCPAVMDISKASQLMNRITDRRIIGAIILHIYTHMLFGL